MEINPIINPSLVAQFIKNLPAMQETTCNAGDPRSLGQEDPIKQEMATYSSIVAWEIPQRSQVGCSPWGHKESDMTYQLNAHHHHPFGLVGTSSLKGGEDLS